MGPAHMWAWTIEPIEPKSLIEARKQEEGFGAVSVCEHSECVRRHAKKRGERNRERKLGFRDFYLTIGGKTLSVLTQILYKESLQ